MTAQKRFLDFCGMDYPTPFLAAGLEAAPAFWQRHIAAKRVGLVARRPVADLLIGGFAMRFQGLMSRNPADFQPWFPDLEILVP